MKAYGPYTIELIAHLTDGEQVAEAKYRMGVGSDLTAEDIQRALDATEKQLKDSMGDEWRLCTKREFYRHLMDEMGVPDNFVIPNSEAWDKREAS